MIRRRRSDKGQVPYASATAGTKARAEIEKILRHFGCESVGFMDDWAKHEVLLAFTHRGRNMQIPVSAKGWAQKWLKENPQSYRSRLSHQEYEQEALRQGHIAVNSILRDLIKGQVTALECGSLSVEAVFMPFMLTSDGRPLIEAARELLPKPNGAEVVALPSASASSSG
jgi:stress-induced morphogen